MALTAGGISSSDLVDLMRTTLPALPSDFEVAQQNQTNEIVNNWFNPGEREEYPAGTGIVKNIMLDSSGNAQHVRMFQQRSINVADVQSRFTMPWCMVTFYWAVERNELVRARKPAAFINLLSSRQTDAELSTANLLQLRGWLGPESSSDDLNPYGVPFWINKIPPSTATGYSSTIDAPSPYGGFVGRRIIYGQTSTPTYVLTNKAGINPTSNALFRNYAGVYTAMDAQCIKFMRDLFHAVRFKSPRIVKDLVEGPLSKYRIYMNRPTLVGYEDLATKMNDNIGPDLAPYQDATSFKRVPIEYANQLDQDNAQVNSSWGCDPIYFINHSKFRACVLEGQWFYRYEPMSDVTMPGTIVTWHEGTYQYECTNVREGGGVLHKALTN